MTWGAAGIAHTIASWELEGAPPIAISELDASVRPQRRSGAREAAGAVTECHTLMHRGAANSRGGAEAAQGWHE